MTEAAIAAPASEAAPQIAPAPAPPAENTTESVARETDNPIKVAPREAPPAEVKKLSIKESIANARAKADAAEAAPKETAKAEAPAKAAETGKEPVKAAEAAKPADTKAEPWREAPKRFNETERAEWDKAPDSAKQGIHRALSEAEKGIEKYRKDATEYAELGEFKELAAKYKTTLKDAMKNYVSIDQALQGKDPRHKLAAIEHILSIAKVTPQEYAAFVTKQPADKVAQRTDATVQQLQRQVHELTQRLQGVSTGFETQQRNQLEHELNAWAADKPMAERLADQIAVHVEQGLPLDEAYAKAEEEFREMALAAGFIPAQAAPVIPPAAHNPKALRSITGAPSAGSFPATQKPSTSIMEAVRKAIAAQN